ncbi:DUF1214 domain-containing protein [uncultured Shimia sp.]|uniref:DUF1214 domain-containing protein n=1 Tax=uncultured Shimia sp. TaxID=573152 RepID=UPI00261F7968|nr:DUF1214 domain-containing protein [uncultured Shimia sp.]
MTFFEGKIWKLSVLAALLGSAATAQNFDATLDSMAEAKEVPVNLDNFIRAATDIELEKYVSLAGGVNKFFHFLEPTDVNLQPTIRMNRDTLYSSAVIDISQGATLTLPDVGDRYMTAMIVNQDHFINEVFYGGGTFTLDMETFDSPYVVAFIRILVDASDAEDVAEVNAIQKQMQIEAPANAPFLAPVYDEESFVGLLQTILAFAPFLPDSRRMFGPKDEVDGVRHLIGTAGGWGGLPEDEALYLGIEPGLPVGAYKIEVPAEVPVEAFWSVSAYNAAGFFEPNEAGVYNINSVSGASNEDGSMTVHFGSCEDGRINCMPIVDGWNYTVRLYRPGAEILDGSWSFPEVQPVGNK